MGDDWSDTEVDHDNQWQGEDENSDLNDDWDASSDEEVKEVKAAPVHVKKKTARQLAKEKEEQEKKEREERAAKLAAQTPEEKMAENLRLQKIRISGLLKICSVQGVTTQVGRRWTTSTRPQRT